GRAEAHECVVALQAQHHADREPADADDHEREHAELVELVDEQPDAPRRRQSGADDVEREECQRAEVGDESHDRPAEILHRPDHAGPRAAVVPGRSSGATTERSSPSLKKATMRGSVLRCRSPGEPSTVPSGSSTTTWSAMRIVEGM